jgi:hypothetical protein
MIYARVHDQALAEDYYAAMSQIEKRLELCCEAPANPVPLSLAELGKFDELIRRLTEPTLEVDSRLEIAAQMRQLLNRWYTTSTPANVIPREVHDENPIQASFTLAANCG